LEDALLSSNGAQTEIIVTQPRKIAAVSVAERVADERHEKIGNSVGYTVRFNRKAPREAGGTIEFVTTGVLLNRIMNDPLLEGVSHVVIDEGMCSALYRYSVLFLTEY
jgi:ATP-dependent RNA helicase DHX36